MKIIKNQVSLNGKFIQFHCKNNVFLKVLQVACANEKGINKTSQMKAKSISKSIQNRCENDAQTSDAKMMENCAKMDPKR